MRRKTKAVMAMILLALFTLPLRGSGSVGPVERLGPVFYPIIEPDWSTWLPRQAEKHLRERPLTFSRDQVREAIKQKMPEIDLSEVKVPRTYTVDPSVQVGRPVTDHTGKIVVPAGARVNPLERFPAFRPIVIINGMKKKQVGWAAGLQESPLALITSGDVFELSQRLGRPVYPAPKALLDRFAIERAPVMLSSKGGMIEIEEVALP
ncbi:hypothetical protein [Candidatus Manganitrophus noduliformans]|uniref:Conjugal transfer pilus assembly protein TraW n=1 Tax=Candidatus Manganitrophus noduliformans TaxID=2606439 RepID=A0A7X6DT13_9BACT|nr:hypothetical protein [Candidatus Manganitrophus noduliformans]NKE72842.1 hypothetical protein [Candidatus Manganitrophus noduliformans]